MTSILLREDLDGLSKVQYLARFGASFDFLGWEGSLLIDDTGHHRLGCCAGWILGLRAAGQPELAKVVAENFIRNLAYLHRYGEDVELTRYGGLDLLRPVKVRNFRIRLSSDSEIGDFRVQWFMLQSSGPNYPNLTVLCPEASVVNNQAAKLVLGYQSHTFGGLILHGAGNQTWAVEVTSENYPHWSLHT